MNNLPVRVAILDLYNREKNLGMGNIKNLLTDTNQKINGHEIIFDTFETRFNGEIPDLNYDIYISSGGPGSPYEGVGKIWEMNYFDLVEKVWNFNQKNSESKKHFIFICHSFQLMCRFFNLALVTRRRSMSFGIFPVHKTEAGEKEPIFEGLSDPYYAADFRLWQVIQSNQKAFDELGAKLLSLEKIRPHVPYERAIMAIRVSDEFIGTQYHPEANPEAMMYHFRQPERKKQVVDEHGEKKYDDMINRIEEPDYITRTYNAVLPNFLKTAIHALRPELN